MQELLKNNVSLSQSKREWEEKRFPGMDTLFYNKVRQELANQDWSFGEKNNIKEAWLEMKRVFMQKTTKYTIT